MNAFETLPSWLPVAFVGVMLLLFGRRLYWVLLGLVGFVLGFSVLAQFVATATSWAPWVAGAVGGALGIAAAIFVQGALLAVVGAVLGAFAALVTVSMLAPNSAVVMMVAAIVGAIAGAMVLRKLFFATLILVTALAGARLLLEALIHIIVQMGGSGFPTWAWELATPGPTRTVLFVCLVVVGVVYQASGNRKAKKERRLRRQKKELERDVKRLRRERQGS